MTLPRKPTPADQLLMQLIWTNLGPIQEFRFHPTRKWRFDFAWPDCKLACEVEGGIFVAGRHSRGAGMKKDMEKYAEALLLGWRVLRVEDSMIKSGKAVEYIQKLLCS